MEIHKVKPIHTWRDFLKELGTIVLGIVIAITLEHLVEEWRWERDVAAARQALKAEILTDNTNLFARRVAIAPCIDRKLGKAGEIISALQAKKLPDPFVDFRVPIGFLINDGEWQSQRASQVLTHFPRDELAVFSRYYATVPDFESFMAREEAAWAALSVLQKPATGMTASDLDRLRVNLFVAQRSERLIYRNAQRQLYFSKVLGISDPKADDALVKNFCSDMSWNDYQQWLYTSFANPDADVQQLLATGSRR